MANYLLLESRDPFEATDAQFFSELVEGIAKRRHKTVLFLLQNGVLPARKDSQFNPQMTKLVKSGVRVLADEFSLKERAITKLAEGVEVSNMDQLVDLLLEKGTKAIWH